MGYGMGQEDQRAKRKARLAARYGTPPPPADDTAPAVWSDAAVHEPAPEAVEAMAPPKKKGGRPKGSKNKAR